MPATVVLVVEDDAAIRRGLCDALKFSGYSPVACARGDECIDLVVTSSPDLVLLDILLPGVDGLTLLEQLRECRPQLPIIMLTALGTEEDKVRGLRSGADDYVVKPFSASEVLARIEAVLRRSVERPRDIARVQCGDRDIDFLASQIVLASGEQKALSVLESDLLRYLVVHRGRAISRTELLHRVWGANGREIDTRTVDMHIRRLRTKLEPRPSDPVLLRTVRGQGYMFTVAEDG